MNTELKVEDGPKMTCTGDSTASCMYFLGLGDPEVQKRHTRLPVQ